MYVFACLYFYSCADRDSKELAAAESHPGPCEQGIKDDALFAVNPKHTPICTCKSRKTSTDICIDVLNHQYSFVSRFKRRPEHSFCVRFC